MSDDAVGYASIIPNFPNLGAGGGGIQTGIYSHWAGVPWPNMVHDHMYVYQESDTVTAEMQNVLDTFSRNYVLYQNHLGVENATFGTTILSKSDFLQGIFLRDGSISFVQSMMNYKQTLQMRINDNFGVEISGDPAN